MPKYRHKPIIVDAEQFFPEKKPWPKGVEMRRHFLRSFHFWDENWRAHRSVVEGGWLLTFGDGSRRSMTNTQFCRKYDPIDEADDASDLPG